MFSAHINVEFCNSVKSIQYICKYVHKGADRAVIELAKAGDPEAATDEITFFQTGRYISTNEAFWRIFGFPIQEHESAVIHLNVHLENGLWVYLNQENILDCANQPQRTTLTRFFELCTSDCFARRLLYAELPTFYTWNIFPLMAKKKARTHFRKGCFDA
ncbi:uncharacterized protein LOC115213325 [Octopus sinensis]|uniref:Uncharacterized protein LOC115213325 n=1 Tax=Octopus sinensis TaxID=2607531 RepID=A0A6P7SJL0_9MOLL|nr:uncharacterized protein LOC115213325 [Octopus sinensis]